MMYPLVREPTAAAAPHRVPVVVTCRVLGLARQPYYRWLARPVTDAELTEAYRADALFDAHRVGPEFGHRFLLDEAHAAGEPMAERTAWRICRDNRWWSAFGKRRGRGKNAKAGPPVHDDRIRRDFTAYAHLLRHHLTAEPPRRHRPPLSLREARLTSGLVRGRDVPEKAVSLKVDGSRDHQR
ncbi:hypothetical protein [Streptomyces sp. NPDC057966]|uniref:hypothetical protein n=1 Tax=Streptomyces sp. NPDC057966 TaxID=3346292 RepID=UPI0036E3BD1B